MQDGGEADPEEEEETGGSEKPIIHTIVFWANQVFTVNGGESSLCFCFDFVKNACCGGEFCRELCGVSAYAGGDLLAL